MTADKKNRSGQIHFSLPAELGRMHRTNGWTVPVANDVILPALGLIV
jgi:3-dehydroquinate synthetase